MQSFHLWNDTWMATDNAPERPSLSVPAAESDELARALGSRITALRKQRGWSLSALAARAGLGKATLSRIEAGNRNPTLETVYAIAAQLGVPLAALLTSPPASALTTPAQLRGQAVTATLIDVIDDAATSTELYRLQIATGATQISPGHGPGVTEHLMVIRGSVLVGPVGAEIRIDTGGYGHWASDTEHSYAAIGNRAAEALVMIRHPHPHPGTPNR
jgi:transcriptional regulator with XRE-family HTH domain